MQKTKKASAPNLHCANGVGTPLSKKSALTYANDFAKAMPEVKG
jgi:hypothetical protein